MCEIQRADSFIFDFPTPLLTHCSSRSQIYWAIFTNDTAFPVVGGVGVSVYNLLLSTINSLVFVHRVSKGKTSPLRSGWMQYVGLVMLIAGVGLELTAEETRKRFKKQPKNKGKVDDTGESGLSPCLGFTSGLASSNLANPPSVC